MKITKRQLRKIIESLIVESANDQVQCLDLDSCPPHDKAALSDLGLDDSFEIFKIKNDQVVIRKKISNDDVEMAGEASRWMARSMDFETPYEKKSLQPDPISPEYGYFYYKRQDVDINSWDQVFDN